MAEQQGFHALRTALIAPADRKELARDMLTDLALSFSAPLVSPESGEGGDPNIRWLQSAINRVMNAGLVVDGVAGSGTREAVRAFQSSHGLAADGTAGPRTMTALREALNTAGSERPPVPPSGVPSCLGLPARQVLDGFAFGQARIEPQHQPMIDQIAACLAASLHSETPITRLTLIGHTDPVGDDAANDALGLRRATAVADAIRARLRQFTPDAGRLTFDISTHGEHEPVAGDPAHSRRVEVVAPFAFPRRRPVPPEPPFRSPLDPARWGPILVRAFDASTVIRSGNAVRHLVDAENPAHPALAGYGAMVEAIRSASGGDAFIYLLGWICINDFDMITCDPTSKLRELLTAAAGRGVQVRAVLWEPSVGRAHTRQNEASARHINGLPGGAAIIDGEHLRFGSHHQKLLVVGGGESGLIGFTGGLDVNKDRILPSTIHCPVISHRAAPEASYSPATAELDIESMSGGGGDPLHDVHCRVEGPSAFDLLQTFIRRWDHHPDSRHIEARMPLRGRSRPVPTAISVPIPPTKSSTGRSCSVAIGRTFNPRSGSGMPCERNIQRGLLAAIGNARRFIYMEDQYLINPDAARALRAALPRLEHLTILLSASEINSDTPCIWTYRREWVHDLKHGLPPAQAAKVRLFHLVSPPIPATPPPCAISPFLRRFLPTFGRHTYIHAKCWVFDDELAVIGSANCNRRGWQHDTEIDAFIFDDSAPARRGERTLAQQLRMDLWAEHLDQPAGTFEDGVASAAAWLSPHTSARVVRYCPNEGSDVGEFKCGLIRDTIVDPPAACG